MSAGKRRGRYPDRIREEIETARIHQSKLSRSGHLGHFTHCMNSLQNGVMNNVRISELLHLLNKLDHAHALFQNENDRYLGHLGRNNPIESRLAACQAQDIQDQYVKVEEEVKQLLYAPSSIQHHSTIPDQSSLFHPSQPSLSGKGTGQTLDLPIVIG